MKLIRLVNAQKQQLPWQKYALFSIHKRGGLFLSNCYSVFLQTVGDVGEDFFIGGAEDMLNGLSNFMDFGFHGFGLH
ncbi:MAG: hypothetical protein IJU81_06350 [Bacteroidales bacterium]|nr:hypothetical protein [Bacteroidales bacterium]